MIEKKMSTATMDLLDSNLFVDDDELDQVTEENSSQQKEVKNKRKRNKKKKVPKVVSEPVKANDDKENEAGSDEEKIEIELVPEEIKLDKNYEEFSKIFEHFRVNYYLY